MPRHGYRSITLPARVYDYFEMQYTALKKRNALPPGINCFSNYMVYRLENHIQEREALKKLLSRVQIPVKIQIRLQ